MTEAKSIVINGDLGSGKTTVSVGLAERLGLRRVSAGDIHRKIAQERRLSTLQLNRQAELDRAIDDQVDQTLKDLASSPERLVVDSRLAWFFIPHALKVHLLADHTVAARRVLARPSDMVERYASLEEAKVRLRERSESERQRFLSLYGADKHRLRNYDLVCDTTRSTAEEIAERIVATIAGAFDGAGDGPPLLLLDPVRLYPSKPAGDGDGEAVADPPGPEAIEPIAVGYTGERFFVVDGHRRLSTALRRGFGFVPARLAAEGNERLADGRTPAEAFAAVDPATIHAWERAHGIHLPLDAPGDPGAAPARQRAQVRDGGRRPDPAASTTLAPRLR